MPPRPKVLGVDLDPQTRCKHYRSALDVIAIKMKCCREYYACKDCHEEMAGHTVETWPQNEWGEKAVLCGVCGTELTIHQYMESGFQCPGCQALFNPGCKNHYHFYFQQA
jgi:uncharacterized CHY-type Zn-finger protein